MPSTARTAAVGKYLVALASSLADAAAVDQRQSSSSKEPSNRRKQLHVLYLVNDLLHNTKFHADLSSFHVPLSRSLQPHLIDLFGQASASGQEAYNKHCKKISTLLDLWEQKDYYPKAYLEELRDATRTVPRAGQPAKNGEARGSNGVAEDLNEQKKDAPFIMPAMHGDNSSPFYDLPAGNMMPHIIPNLPGPIKPHLMKPLQLAAGPADEDLVAAVKTFMKDIDSLNGTRDQHNDTIADIDALGQPAIRDEDTGEFIGGEGYYGWSQAFCERMQRRRDDKMKYNTDMGRGPLAQRSRSPRKRRRYSDSDSSRSRSRSPSRSISYSPPRSKSRYEKAASEGRGRSSSGALSPPERGSTLDQSPHLDSGSPQETRPRERSMSRPRSGSLGRSVASSTAPQAQPSGPANGHPPTPQLPLPTTFNGAFPIGPNGLPIPPPPPPNYTGPWPPPPPPLSSAVQKQQPQAQGGSFSNFPNFLSPPSASLPSSQTSPGQAAGFEISVFPHVMTGNQNQMSTHRGSWLRQQTENHNGVLHGGRPYRDSQNP